MSSRGVPTLDPTLNRVFAELVLVAEADRDVNARPHSNVQVLGYARAARRYATARCWDEAVAVLQQLAMVDGHGVETALRDKVHACARALDGALRVGRIEVTGPLRNLLVTFTTPPGLTAVPHPTVTTENTEHEEKTPA